MKPDRYPLVWRVLHWLIALMVLTLLVVGFWMVSRSEADLWDALTGNLYASHKAIGFSVLWLMVLRLVIRITRRPPEYPESVSSGIKKLAASTHHLMYLLLFAIPLLGWAGVTAYPALIVAGGVYLPAMPGIPEDQALAKQLFSIHGTLAIVLCVLIAIHIAGALKHLLINKDGVFERMGLGKKR
jgi:cytochrome b561